MLHSEIFNELAILIQSRCPLIYLASHEEERVMKNLLSLANVEKKKIYLLQRINDEHDLLEKLRVGPGKTEFNYVLKQSKDHFIFSAPEIVDYCFEVLSKYISLNRDSFENPPQKVQRNDIKLLW